MRDVVPFALLALSGFLAGGAYATFRTSKWLALVLTAAMVLAAVSGALWLF